MFFFTDYLSHVPLSGHNDNFSKYDKKLFLYRLLTSALRLQPLTQTPPCWNLCFLFFFSYLLLANSAGFSLPLTSGASSCHLYDEANFTLLSYMFVFHLTLNNLNLLVLSF